MNKNIQHILNELGAAFEAQIAEAKEQAKSFKDQNARLLDGLRILLDQSPQISANDNQGDSAEADIGAPNTEKTQAAKKSRTRQSVPDSVFTDALTIEWISGGDLFKLLNERGHKVAEGTVYNRMRKLSHERPDEIEAAQKPERWRLKGCVVEVERESVPNKKSHGRKRVSNNVSPQRPEPQGAANDDGVALHLPILHRGDCLEIMRTIDDRSVDLILADLPYAVSRLSIDDPIDMEALWREYRRIIKPRGNILLFATQPFANKLINAAPDLFKYDLIWEKPRATGFGHAASKPMKAHENILVFTPGTTISPKRSKETATYNPQGVEYAVVKSRPRRPAGYLNGLNVGHEKPQEYVAIRNCPRSILKFAKDAPVKGQKAHPFAKPVALLEYLIRTFSDPGQVVLDNTMGSGSTCIAAMRMGRLSIGIEKDQNWFDFAVQRVSKANDAAATMASTNHANCNLPVMASFPPKFGITDSSSDASPEAPAEASGNAASPQSSLPVPLVHTAQSTLYNGDCLEVMREMPSGSIDLVVTSPPYNLGISSGGGLKGGTKSGIWKNAKLAAGYASYDDARPIDEYVAWQKQVLNECWRLLSPDGAIFFNHKPRIQNGKLWTPLELNPGLPVRQIEAQRRGIGAALLDEAKRQLSAGLTLRTPATNLAAHRFYERHGLSAIKDAAHPVTGAPVRYFGWRQ